MKNDKEHFELSPPQLGVYLHELKYPDSTAYRIPMAFEFDKENIDIPKLKKAIEDTLAENEIFSYRLDDSGPSWSEGDERISVKVQKVSAPEFEAIKKDFVKAGKPLVQAGIYESEDRLHVLFDIDHMLFDGSSLAVLLDEISRHYQNEPSIPASSYKDYVKSLKAIENSTKYQQDLDYFISQLEGVEGDFALVQDHSIKNSTLPAGHTSFFVPDDVLPQAVLENEGYANAYFLAGLEYALASFNGADEAMVIAAYHGRNEDWQKRIIGMIVKTLPIYTQIDQNLSTGEFVAQIKAAYTEAVRHSDVPFQKLADRLGLEMGVSYAFQSDRFNTWTLDNQKAELELLETHHALCPLSIMVFKQKEGFRINLDYQSDLYSKATIDSFTRLYHQVLKELAQKKTLKQISLADEKVLETYRKQKEQAYRDVDFDRSFITRFEDAAAKYPDHEAVIFEDRSYSYGDVKRITDAIARFLKEKGYQKGQVAGIMTARNEWMNLAPISVLKNGMIYLPLDPDYPASRLQYMLEDSDAALLLVSRELSDHIPEFKGEVIVLEDLLKLEPSEFEPVKVSPEDGFVMLYTSGSTGQPKGVVLKHRNLVNFINNYVEMMELDQNSSTAAYASFGFDAHMIDLYPFMAIGASQHIIPADKRLDLNWINEYGRKNQIEHLFMTTQVGRTFVDSLEDISYKKIGTGGEALNPVSFEGDLKFFNLYGPTETMVYATWYPVKGNESSIPIGKPVGNAAIYIVDELGRLLPPEAVGEITIAGDLVSRGYLNRPEQTEKVFTENPFESEPSSKLYHTGDLGRFLEDGNLQYIGRRDGLVKIRGFRIELGEIESVIREFDGIRDVSVLAAEQNGNKFLAAYLVSDEPVDRQALRSFIAQRKPSYMVPDVYIDVDEIPLTINQKVDRKRLPKPTLSKSEAPVQGALSFLQKQLLEMIEEIAGIQIGTSDNLSHTGMSSLSIIRLAAMIHEKYHVNLDSRKLLEGITILELEQQIFEALLEKAVSPKEEIRSEIRESMPLSDEQFGVFSESLRHPESQAYAIPFLYSFPEGVKKEKLIEAIEKTFENHPQLFVQLDYEGDQVVQKRIRPESLLEIKPIHKGALDLVLPSLQKPFELINHPLYQAVLLEEDGKFHLFLNVHHLIFDGSSVGILLREIADRYENRPVDKEELDYFGFVQNQNTHSKEKARAFYDQMFAPMEASTILAGDQNGPQKPAELFEPIDLEPVQAFCKAHNIRPSHLYLGAVLYVLSRFTFSRQAYISTISSGRDNPQLARTIGMFVKTLPVGLEIEKQSGQDYLIKIRELLEQSMAADGLSLSEIHQIYGFEPRILFAYQLGLEEPVLIENQEITLREIAERQNKFDLAIYIEKQDGKPGICLLYNAGIYSQKLMETLIHSIQQAIRALMENPEAAVQSISLIDQKQKEKLEAKASTTIRAPKHTLMHHLFEEQVKLHPERLALIAKDGKFSYATLDEKANRIANALIEKGIRPKERVVLLLERNSDFIASMYGVLKAGATFIPMNPDYPRERILEVLNNSDAAALISDQKHHDYDERFIDIESLKNHPDISRPEAEVNPEDLAYMIYTSGSTGKPKGVKLSHLGISSYLENTPENLQVAIPVSEAKTYGSITNISFDMSLKETAMSLSNGLTLAFAWEELLNDPVKLAAFLKENEVDIFNATPTRMLAYLEAPEFMEALKQMKVILAGGERYPMELLNVLQKNTEARLINTYGPTEITVSSNGAELTHADSISVGRPLFNYTEYIVDQDDNLLPEGVAGELIIGGPGVAKGYNKLEEQTEKAFFERNGIPFYRSGDLARWNDRDEIVILDRKDNQIKLRGLRIELDEIQKVLSELENIKKNTVLIRTLNNQDELVAFIETKEAADLKAIRDHLASKLPAYMIPAHIEVIDRIPMTFNGKTDIKALKSMPLSLAQTEVQMDKDDLSTIQKDLLEIFEGILNHSIGLDQSFFDAGGTSLSATRLVIQASKKGYELSYGDIFDYPSINQLAALIEKQSKKDVELLGLEDFSDYDYSAIDEVLENNTLENFIEGDLQPLGDVILTGATGFLGIHILYIFLRNYPGKIYPLVRSKKGQDARERLEQLFYYYFESDLFETYKDRIEVIEGDITDEKTYEKLTEIRADVLINCAADVRHFSKSDDIEKTNYQSIKYLIDLCLEKNLRLIQVSTMSVGGMYIDHPGEKSVLGEQDLFMGQLQSSKYTSAKFLAEREILDEIPKGLRAKIMRVGTLAPRKSDGEYQINFTTNSFMGRLRAAHLIGSFSYDQMENLFELSPIDEVARAILLLAQTPDENVLFHPYNNHQLMMQDLYRQMNALGLMVNPKEKKDYLADLEAAGNDERAEYLSSFIAYENMAHGKKAFSVGKSNPLTMQVLYRMGFTWPETSWDYMQKFLENLMGFGYFDFPESE